MQHNPQILTTFIFCRQETGCIQHTFTVLISHTLFYNLEFLVHAALYPQVFINRRNVF